MGWVSGASYSVFFITVISGEEYNRRDTMDKLLVITVLVALLALSAETFRIPRQAEEEQGNLTKIRSLYDSTLSSATDYMNSIRGLKLEEKAMNLYADTSKAIKTYAGIFHDQLYHIFYNQQ
ncbi:apolipoprotein C-II [Xiphias gladius]|uniref:apolipoprotein C-II n=1 Tax=Xiphias gladius TaxID=8245 RepID=UPI001A995C0E|nr:apolipoprotein C-II [Xiphias gladius]